MTERDLFNTVDILEPDDSVLEDDMEVDDSSESENENEDCEISNKFGMRGRCPFNILQAFHSVISMPPDILHDVQEGVIALDLLGILKTFIKKNYFTEEEYNRSLQRHEFRKYESNDRPELINCKKKKLTGKAFSVLVHLRNVGYILKGVIKTDNIFQEKSYKLLTLLHSIVEYLMAPEIRHYELAELQEEILQYLNLRKELFETNPESFQSPKPKTHFLSHYPRAIEKYGPSIGISTSRYEARHRIAKGIAQSGKNFVNIPKTLSKRQQMRAASVFYNGFYNTENVELPENVKRKSDLLKEVNNSSFAREIQNFMDEDSILCSQIKYFEQIYKNDDIIVLEVLSRDFIKVGLIQGILFKSEDVYFVVHMYSASRNENFKYFETHQFDSNIYFILANNLKSYKPLIKHGTALKFSFSLNHHLSVKI